MMSVVRVVGVLCLLAAASAMDVPSWRQEPPPNYHWQDEEQQPPPLRPVQHTQKARPVWDEQPEANPDRPQAIIAFDTGFAFNPQLIPMWVETLRLLGVAQRDIQVITNDEMPAIHKRIPSVQWSAELSACGVITAVQNAGPNVYLVVSAHGTNVLASIDTHGYAQGGSLQFDHKGRCPSGVTMNPTVIVESDSSRSNKYLLQYAHFALMAQGKQQVVVFVDSCLSASVFNYAVRRVDRSSGEVLNKQLVKRKQELYTAPTLANCLFITSTADNCAIIGPGFAQAVHIAVQNTVETGNWDTFLIELKQQSYVRVDADDDKASKGPGQRKGVEKTSPRFFQPRAFGDPQLLLRRMLITGIVMDKKTMKKALKENKHVKDRTKGKKPQIEYKK